MASISVAPPLTVTTKAKYLSTPPQVHPRLVARESLPLFHQYRIAKQETARMTPAAAP